MIPSQKQEEIVEEVSKFFLETLMLAKPPEIPTYWASADSLKILYANLITLRTLLNAISTGDLSKAVSLKGYVGGTLKTLLANLKHMTWQTKMVASGDFSQRIEFMGEFAHSFNAMVVRLDQTLNEVVRKKTELSRINEDLLKEISIRKETEAALRKSEESLRLLAISDSLTGLYNRRHFNTFAEDEVRRALRYSRPLSVMMFDLDFFKRLNDTFGHNIGDKVLMLVARITKEQLRNTDLAARYGGEEFIVLLPETAAPEAFAVAERLRNEIEERTARKAECPITVTASFGVCDYLGNSKTRSFERVLAEFLANVDQALYASKNAGRNRVTVYEPVQEP